MGWQDRSYYRDPRPTSRNPLMWLLSGSVPLFTLFGIRVRMHASLLVLIVVGLIFSGTALGGLGVINSFIGSILLFGIILLHEYGHCFAARWVGGDAHEILMWPLGGLAYADAPSRPWPQFVTAAGGPLVNVIICALTAGLIWLIRHNMGSITWMPFTRHVTQQNADTAIGFLWYVYTISLMLLLFNLWPVFPMDGGRILQTLLWFKLGYYRATMIACVVGMVGAVLMAMWGLTAFGSWYGLLLIIIAVNCFLACYQLRLQLKAAGPWESQEDSVDFSASLWRPDESGRGRRHISRRAARRLRRQAESEEAEQARIDAILAKVSAHGMHSLTWGERRALRKATERQRQREVELSRRG